MAENETNVQDNMPDIEKARQEQKDRLESAGINMPAELLERYLTADDVIAIEPGAPVPEGYKKCGRCNEIKKFYLFNRNASSKINCTGNCKGCQCTTARKSYDKNKDKRDYKQYYAEHKEAKLQQSKEYYVTHKDDILAKQKDYRKTPEGQKIMTTCHTKRKKAMKEHAGIPYTREMVIDRDMICEIDGAKYPLCCLCQKPIMDKADIHMEHLIPVVLGGLDDFTNVGCAHSKCNLQKSKDAHEVTVEQAELLQRRAENYINEHPELFPDFAETEKKE